VRTSSSFTLGRVTLVVLTFLFSFVGSARAEPAKTPIIHNDAIAAVALALEADLTATQRDLLQKMAALPATDVEDCASNRACEALPKGWASELDALVARLSALGGWRAAALRTLITQRRLLEATKARESVDRVVTDLTKISSEPKCADVRSAIATYVQGKLSGKGPIAPITRDTLYAANAKSKTSCMEAIAAKGSLSGHVLLAIFGTEEDELAVVTSGAHPEVLVVPKAHSFTVQGIDRRIFLVAVQRDVQTTVRLDSRSLVSPMVWPSFTSSIDDALWGSPSSLTCFDLMTAFPKDGGGFVLFDGKPLAVTRGIVHAPFGPHVVHAVTKNKDGTLSLHATREIAAESVRGLVGCQRITFDASVARAVALLQVQADSSCAGVGVDSNRLRARVERFLKSTKRETRDVQAWADTIQGFDSLRTALMRLGGSPVGASRDRLDPGVSLGTAANELLRQGFADILTVDLRCNSHGDRAGHFTIAAQRINLTELEKAPRDPVIGLDISTARHTHVEAVRSQSELGGGLVATLSRIFSDEYVRFAEPNEDRPFETISHRVETFVASRWPKAKAVLETVRLEDGDALRICPAVDAFEELRSPEAPPTYPEDATVEVDSKPIGRDVSAPMHVDLLARPQRAGTYLTKVYLDVDGSGEPDNPRGMKAVRCVRVEEPRAHFWIDVSYGVNAEALTPVHDARRGSVGYFQAMAGVSLTAAPNGRAQVGVMIGYGRSTHERDVPPSWDDIPLAGSGTPSANANASASTGYDSRGYAPLTWTRQSFLIGPTFAVHFSAAPCELVNLFHKRTNESYCLGGFRAFGFFLRAIPAIDIGTVSVDELNPAFRTFTNQGSTFNVDGSIFGEAGVSLRINRRTSVYGFFTLAVPALTDLVFGRAVSLRRVTYDAAVMLGGGAGLQWDP
jgi:hypothetical protein